MKMKTAYYMLLTCLFLWGNSKSAFCATADASAEPESLRSFLLKGYISGKSVLDDVRIEYQRTRNLVMDSVSYKELLGRDADYTPSTNIEEYIQKNGKERWAFLYIGKSAPTEDVSSRAELIRKKDSPPFKVFDGKYALDYYGAKDGFTEIGRATLDASKTSMFESGGSTVYAPVKFFGYYPGLMPDDILSSPQVRIETKPERIGSLLTYKVSSPMEIGKVKYNIVYWLAPERSCLPVKIEVERNGMLKRCLETKGFFELEDGRWVIKSILQRNFVSKKGEGSPVELATYTYTLRNLELYPSIDDKTFSTLPYDLPEGVEIIDRRI